MLLALIAGCACHGLAAAAPEAAAAARGPYEIRHRLDTGSPGHAQDVALTLDACGGAYDRELIATLLRLQVPATIFATRRWIYANQPAMRELLAHPALFEIENHGDEHVPALLGAGVYGLHGAHDAAGIEKEVTGGARTIVQATGRAPGWYRAAGAVYDAPGERIIVRLGYRIAGFSLNADDGGTLGAASVARRLRQVQPGDIVIAHLNRPASGLAEGLAEVLPELLARRLRFVKLSQAAGMVATEPRRPAR